MTEQKNPTLICVVNCYINFYIGKNVYTELFILVQTRTGHQVLECMRKLLWKMELEFQKYAINLKYRCGNDIFITAIISVTGLSSKHKVWLFCPTEGIFRNSFDSTMNYTSRSNYNFF